LRMRIVERVLGWTHVRGLRVFRRSRGVA
jgi:hypothetical protein